MAWCAVNGIDLSSIVAVATDPTGDRRDIGEIAPASDGSMRATRQARKHDLAIQSIPLSAANARAWEGLLAGEGQVWSFDSSFYSSKGLPGLGSDGTVVVSGSVVKYGAGALKVPDTKTWETSGLALDGSRAFTAAVWCRVDSGSWHHYVIEGPLSATNVWIDGVLDNVSPNPFDFDGTNPAELILEQPSSGTNFYFDDLVICPFAWPSTWPALVYACGAAFSPLPFLNFSGDLITEAATRTMIGNKVSVSAYKRANPTGAAGGASKVVHVLKAELLER